MTKQLHELWSPEDTPTYVVDADSTAVSVETLDILAKQVLDEQAMAEFNAVTNCGMVGSVSFPESLERRFALMRGVVHRQHVEAAGRHIVGLLDSSLFARRDWIGENPDRLHVVSGGFQELIGPAMDVLGVHNVHANQFVYDDRGFICGADPTRLTSQDNGKAALVASLGLSGKVVAIGDGVNDLQIRDRGHADVFVAYTQHCHRASVVARADAVATSFAEPLLT